MVTAETAARTGVGLTTARRGILTRALLETQGQDAQDRLARIRAESSENATASAASPVSLAGAVSADALSFDPDISPPKLLYALPDNPAESGVFYPNNARDVRQIKTAPLPRTKRVPVTERVIRKQPPEVAQRDRKIPSKNEAGDPKSQDHGTIGAAWDRQGTLIVAEHVSMWQNPSPGWRYGLTSCCRDTRQTWGQHWGQVAVWRLYAFFTIK